MKNLKKIKNRKFKISLIFLAFFSITLGFSPLYTNPMFLVNFRNKLENKFIKTFNSKFPKKASEENCPKKISFLTKDSILIIGHAYGSHKNSDLRGNIGIAPKVYDFYIKNQNNIKSIIFSGDVLKEPSIRKWKNFYSLFKSDIKIYIAPGNHDVGGKNFDSALRDVFNMIPHRNQKGLNFPFKLVLDNSLFIIGDSNAKENQLDEIIKIIKNEKVYKNIYVVIHHVFPEGLREAANSQGRHSYIKDFFLEDKLKNINNKKITFIYGDGGAFREKMRFKCMKLANSYHLISGIGEIPGDTIFVISNRKLYRMEI